VPFTMLIVVAPVVMLRVVGARPDPVAAAPRPLETAGAR
jgi:hypothetical protein